MPLSTCVVPMRRTTPNELSKLWDSRDPEEAFEFGEDWICSASENIFSTKQVTLDPRSQPGFCLNCFYAIKVVNPRGAEDVKIRFKYSVYQEGAAGGFTSTLASGTPTRLALSEGEAAVYKIAISKA